MRPQARVKAHDWVRKVEQRYPGETVGRETEGEVSPFGREDEEEKEDGIKSREGDDRKEPDHRCVEVCGARCRGPAPAATVDGIHACPACLCPGCLFVISREPG